MTTPPRKTPPPDALSRARGQLRAGDPEGALEILTGPGVPGQDSAPAGQVALHANVLNRLGRADEAVRLLDGALARHPADQRLLLALIESHRRRGDAAAARDAVRRGLARFPDAPQLHLQQARLSREADAPEAALGRARALVARFPELAGAHLLLIDLLEETGRPEAARTALADAADRFPDDRAFRIRRVTQAHRHGDYRAALEEVRQARAILPEDPALDIHQATCLAAMGRHREARTLLQAQVRRGRDSPQTHVRLVDLSSFLGDLPAALAAARQGLARFPGDPALIGPLAARAVLRLGQGHDMDDLRAWLETCLPAAARDRLRLQRDVVGMDHAAALARLRRGQTRPPVADTAQQIARMLLQLNRLALARRYLRRCLRRWPGDRRFDETLANVHSKCGHDRAALRLLERAGHDGMSAAFIQLHCGTGDSARALALYRGLRARGEIPPQNAVSLLLRNLLSDARPDDLREVIADYYQTCRPSQGHLRATPFGRIMVETEVELAQPDSALNRRLAPGDTAGHARLVADFPRSNVAAMRYMRHWRRHVGGGAAAGGGAAPPVPRLIHQYWNDRRLPDDIADMVDSWRAVPGFEHRLHDRRAALTRLRRDFGPRWVSAFLMAGKPAEEADLLRLCLLAVEGGVYADTDDRLIGSLPSLLAGGAGLVTYAERGGGMVLGNNFLVARPRHPAIVLAARMARQALLARDKDDTWSKTGPGLLTRAVARYLARCATGGQVPDIAVLDLRDLCRQVAIHGAARHKSSHHKGRPTHKLMLAEGLCGLLREARGDADEGGRLRA